MAAVPRRLPRRAGVRRRAKRKSTSQGASPFWASLDRDEEDEEEEEEVEEVEEEEEEEDEEEGQGVAGPLRGTHMVASAAVEARSGGGPHPRTSDGLRDASDGPALPARRPIGTAGIAFRPELGVGGRSHTAVL
ncbi:hypothetical protein CDD83_8999 [Cordyceps sp. RAO-2017]|nr:hypothetical protein CDD83_8999 [Cordyceps sp. RAO-2017]